MADTRRDGARSGPRSSAFYTEEAEWTRERVRAARALDDRALGLLRDTPGVDRALIAREDGTHAEAVRRLWRAVRRLEVDPDPPPPGARRARMLLRRADEIRWEIALRYRRIAQGEARRWGRLEEAREEILQEAMVGLLTAARAYDPDRGIRFTTYAAWWVQVAAARCAQRDRAVPIPETARRQLQRFRRMASESPELSAAERAARVGLTEAELQQLAARSEPVVSLDLAVRADGSEADRLGDLLPDAEAPARVLRAVETRHERARLDALLELLPPDERQILQMRYLGSRSLSLNEVGAQTGRSRSETRRVEQRAIRKLMKLHRERATDADRRGVDAWIGSL